MRIYQLEQHATHSEAGEHKPTPNNRCTMVSKKLAEHNEEGQRGIYAKLSKHPVFDLFSRYKWPKKTNST